MLINIDGPNYRGKNRQQFTHPQGNDTYNLLASCSTHVTLIAKPVALALKNCGLGSFKPNNATIYNFISYMGNQRLSERVKCNN
nr:hypothetical protein CFP56_30452 [Quercus suber]